MKSSRCLGNFICNQIFLFCVRYRKISAAIHIFINVIIIVVAVAADVRKCNCVSGANLSLCHVDKSIFAGFDEMNDLIICSGVNELTITCVR